MSHLSRKYSEETGDDPVIMNSVGYSSEYVNWLEARVEKFTSPNTARLAISLLTRLERYDSEHSKHEWEYVVTLLSEWRKETAAVA